MFYMCNYSTHNKYYYPCFTEMAILCLPPFYRGGNWGTERLIIPPSQAANSRWHSRGLDLEFGGEEIEAVSTPPFWEVLAVKENRDWYRGCLRATGNDLCGGWNWWCWRGGWELKSFRKWEGSRAQVQGLAFLGSIVLVILKGTLTILSRITLGFDWPSEVF